MARWNRSYKYWYKWMSLKYYCKVKWLNYQTIHQRISKSWWTIEEAVTGIRNQKDFSYPWEERREIKWYEWLYDVSNFGRVRSYRKTTNWVREVWHISRLIKPRKKRQTTTYACVTLYHPTDRKYHYKLNRLVAQAFLWLDYDNKYTLVCHKDDDGINNHIDNLFLWTHKDNTQDSISKWRCKLKHFINLSQD